MKLKVVEYNYAMIENIIYFFDQFQKKSIDLTCKNIIKNYLFQKYELTELLNWSIAGSLVEYIRILLSIKPGNKHILTSCKIKSKSENTRKEKTQTRLIIYCSTDLKPIEALIQLLC